MRTAILNCVLLVALVCPPTSATTGTRERQTGKTIVLEVGVMDHGSKKAIPHASVFVMSRETGEVARTVTDEAGTARLRFEPGERGHFYLFAEADGYFLTGTPLPGVTDATLRGNRSFTLELLVYYLRS
jgi:hypothetical protein